MILGTAWLTFAWLFVHPLQVPISARLWLLLPLVACVAAVYRATRVRTVQEMPRATVITFISILAGMGAIAIAFYALHLVVRHYF